HRRRRTKAKEEVTRGSRKLKPITPPLKGKGLHTLLFLMRPFPHGVLDTSAESIPNFETKNKVLTHFLARLTQFSARFRCKAWIHGSNFGTFEGRNVRAGLWVDFNFRRRYASEARGTSILIKLNYQAILCVKSG